MDVRDKIVEWFLKPLTKYKPNGSSLKDWLDNLFHLKNREIKEYIVDQDFTMLGMLVAAPYIKYYGTGDRKINKGTLLYYRYDWSLPNYIDVEIIKDNRQQVFSLTKSEWEKTIIFLKELPEDYKSKNKTYKEYTK